MPIYLGNTQIDYPYILGNVSEMYLGSTLVWKAGLPAGTTYDFGYTGSVQSIELPRGTYKLQCWGAQGGTSYGSSSGAGSKGGYSEGVLTLTKKTTIYIFVGGKGSRGSSTSLVNGGWNGGGASVGYSSYNNGDTDGYSYPACGGGATDMCLVTSTMSYSSGRTNRSSASLLSRFIVAGGGAGGSCRVTTETTTTSGDTTTYNAPEKTTTAAGNSYGNWAPYGWDIPDAAGATFSVTISKGNGYYKLEFYDASLNYISGKYNSSTVAPSGTVNVGLLLFGDTQGEVVSGTMKKTVLTTSTSTTSGYSNKSQQGGGTSGRGQYPGTQSSGGNGNGNDGGFGYGGNQSITNYRYCSGGAGGGWYGGGTAYSDSSTSYVNYTGGGSGFVNTAANASYRPSGYTGLELDSGTTTAGNTSHPSTSGGTETGHSGNGYARITVL